jgi:MFS family permease
MLVAETWSPHLRGRVISINRATWCFGASFAGAIAGFIAGTWGWRAAVMVPGVIALLAIYVRATCPESPYWVRTDRPANPDRECSARPSWRAGYKRSTPASNCPAGATFSQPGLRKSVDTLACPSLYHLIHQLVEKTMGQKNGHQPFRSVTGWFRSRHGV